MPKSDLRAPGGPRRPWAWAHEALEMLKEAGDRWSDDNCLRLGAALAYYAVFSIFPLLLLAVTALGFVLGQSPETRARLLDAVAAASTPAFRTLFDETLTGMQTHEAARGIGAAVGFVMLLVGASAMFSELEATLNQIWRVKPTPTKGVSAAFIALVRGKALSFAVVIGAAAALLFSLAVNAVLSSVGRTIEGNSPGAMTHRALWLVIETCSSAGVLTLVLAAIFRLLPRTQVEWRDVFGGALLTAVLFTAIKGALAWYLGHLGSYAAYGAVGGFLALLTWIYLASLFLFYGAAFCRVYAERHGSLAGKPDTRASFAAESSGKPRDAVDDQADDPPDGPDPHARGEPPVGGEGRNAESEEPAAPRDPSRETSGERKMKSRGCGEADDAHVEPVPRFSRSGDAQRRGP
jgi:membrane protein